MPDLSRYHSHSASGAASRGSPIPLATPGNGHGNALPFPAPATMPLPYGHQQGYGQGYSNPAHQGQGQGQRGSWSGSVGGHKAIGMGLGDVGLASSVYLESLMRAPVSGGGTSMGIRRESMPVHLPSSYSNGHGHGITGREYSHYRSPTPQGQGGGLFNGYQITGRTGASAGEGIRGMTPGYGHEGFGGVDGAAMAAGPSGSGSGSGSGSAWDDWEINKVSKP